MITTTLDNLGDVLKQIEERIKADAPKVREYLAQKAIDQFKGTIHNETGDLASSLRIEQGKENETVVTGLQYGSIGINGEKLEQAAIDTAANIDIKVGLK